MNPLLRLGVEAGPLVVFFVANSRAGLFWATGAFMAATVAALVINYTLERRLPTVPLVSGVFVLFFGGLTLALADETFIKLKPTIVNSLFAAILAAGLALDRLFLRNLFEHAFRLDDDGWRQLTLRWIGFFILLAGLNEYVWRGYSTDDWVAFKTFGILPLTFVFTLLQIPLIKRHQPAGGE